MNIAAMMKQAQAMQTKMQDLETRMAQAQVEGTSGGGAVRATLTCKGEPLAISLSSEIINPAEKDLLEDLILAALKDAYTKGKEAASSEMQQVMGGLNLPAGLKLPF